MGLSWEEQQETIIEALNQLCYGLFRYSSKEQDLDIKRQLIYLWDDISEKWHIRKRDVENVGGLYSHGYLYRFLEEMESDD